MDDNRVPLPHMPPVAVSTLFLAPEYEKVTFTLSFLIYVTNQYRITHFLKFSITDSITVHQYMFRFNSIIVGPEGYQHVFHHCFHVSDDFLEISVTKIDS